MTAFSKNLRRVSRLRFDRVSDVFLGVKTDRRVELLVHHLCIYIKKNNAPV